MARWVFNVAEKLFLQGDVFSLKTNTVKAMLVLSTSTIQRSALSLAGITNIIEFDGTGYSRQTLTSKTFTQNNTTNIGTFDAADINFGSLGIPSATYNLLLYIDGVDDAARIPLLFNGDSPFPLSAVARSLPIRWAATGILQLGNAT